ncbi:MAG: Fic family protein, partial [Blastocatellia bacterium]|nr:Fic family protein [Blastocatellia bacterium]
MRQTLLRTSQEIDEDRLGAAADLISAWAGETEAQLNVERLLEVQRALMGAQSGEDLLRKTEPLPINERHDPTPARLLPRMLDNAFDWFATPGFNELHPVEQSTVVYLRLLDLHPFSQLTETTALLAAGFYTERAGLPPLILFADEGTQARYSSAIDAAFRMLTQPLVELFAEMLRRAMRLSIGAED